MTTAPNPWLAIPADEYEAHMRSPQVGQTVVLSRLFGEALAQTRASDFPTRC